jgi:hypothetical protein
VTLVGPRSPPHMSSGTRSRTQLAACHPRIGGILQKRPNSLGPICAGSARSARRSSSSGRAFRPADPFTPNGAIFRASLSSAWIWLRSSTGQDLGGSRWRHGRRASPFPQLRPAEILADLPGRVRWPGSGQIAPGHRCHDPPPVLARVTRRVELAAPLTQAALRGSWPSAAAGVIDARQVDMRSSRMGPRLAWREA